MREHLINIAVQAYKDIHSDSRTPLEVFKLHYKALADMTFDEYIEYLNQIGQSQDYDLLIFTAVALGLVQITTGESLGCHIDPNNSFGWCPEDYD